MITAPVREAARAFGATAEPALLLGGQGGTWKAGHIVLKPTADPAESAALADLVHRLARRPDIRIPQPIKSDDGAWVADGYVAWEYLAGAECVGRYQEKLRACTAFCSAFAGLGRPTFLAERHDPWALADRVAWGEIAGRYGDPFDRIIDALRGQEEAIDLPCQLMHGDIAGNILFADALPVGVIDITLYWRPVDFTQALLVVDAIAWEGADLSLYEQVSHLPGIEQLVLRAGLRRIIEQPEQVKAFGKNRQVEIGIAVGYERTLSALRSRFSA